ncbi:MAG: type II CRISPR RNA-guided endonuclease Cas9 [bacterium]
MDKKLELVKNLIDLFIVLGHEQTSNNDIIKLKLYIQQDGISLYSGEPIELYRLFENDYCQIDHILPISKSNNDMFTNKTLCFAEENQYKSAKLPSEWISNRKKFAEFKKRVMEIRDVIGFEKVNNFLADRIE